MQEKKSPVFRFVRAVVTRCYPKPELIGTEKIPDGPVIFVGNHAQMHGPIISELYLPGQPYTWCAGQMMHRDEVPSYAYQDFWSQKPTGTRWFYRLLSRLIAPLSVCLFNNARTIAVYHDARLASTFRQTVEKLQNGVGIVIFPEHNVPHNHILCEFQDRFIDVARICYKKTGWEPTFVPMYIAPALKQVCFGNPIRFRGEAPIREERARICTGLMDEITRMACALPEHTVVPYRNIPKRLYPSSIVKEVSFHEAAGR